MQWHENMSELDFEYAVDLAHEDGRDEALEEYDRKRELIAEIPVNSFLGVHLYPAAAVTGRSAKEYALNVLEEHFSGQSK